MFRPVRQVASSVGRQTTFGRDFQVAAPGRSLPSQTASCFILQVRNTVWLTKSFGWGLTFVVRFSIVKAQCATNVLMIFQCNKYEFIISYRKSQSVLEALTEAWIRRCQAHSGCGIDQKKLSSIEDRGPTNRITALTRSYALDIDLWPWFIVILTFNPRRAMVVTQTQTTQVHRPVSSKDKLETNGRTDGQTDGR